MRKARGAKRKAAAAEVVVVVENNNKKKVKVAEQDPPEEQAGPSRRKRVKAPTTPHEFFQEKRNMEDLWRAVFPVGIEWDQFDMVYQFNWNFSNLEDAFEENGVLHGNKVYLFSCTEPQLVPVNSENKVICIPVVVAIVSPFPPSNKIGINSVQREAEEILPMKKMKMDWVPYIPLAYRDSQVDRLKSQIFILSCTQRSMDLDFKLGPATSISVQSTSVADQFVTSEAKDNFPLTASPRGDSVESSGRPGAALVRDTNTTDNLLLFYGENDTVEGERNSKPRSRSNIAQSEQVSQIWLS